MICSCGHYVTEHKSGFCNHEEHVLSGWPPEYCDCEEFVEVWK